MVLRNGGVSNRRRRAGGSASRCALERAQFVGAAGCKSSSCHGGAGEKRSQYITWLRAGHSHPRLRDPDQCPLGANGGRSPVARHYRRLTTRDSKRPLHHLPLALPGRSPSPPPRRGGSARNPSPVRAATAPPGGGSAAIRERIGPTPRRVGAGMRDLRSFYVRANTCVACHQNLDTDILAAGHPELVFELDSQSVAEPKHWQDEPGSGVRAWLVGQAVALRELSWRLSVAPAGDPARLSQWQALAWLLAEVTSVERTLLPIESPNRRQFRPRSATGRRARPPRRAAGSQRRLRGPTATSSRRARPRLSRSRRRRPRRSISSGAASHPRARTPRPS